MAVVLVTGSNSGFGKLIVQDLLSAGHSVIATMRKAEQRKTTFSELEQKNLLVLQLDITNDSERKAVFKEVEKRFAKLDVLVNNAGVGLYGPLENISEEELRRQMEVNFFGAALLSKLFLPLLRVSSGKIINISSMMGFSSMPLSSAYSASKFALEGLSQGLAYELKPFGVQVCNVQPGRHRTNFSSNLFWAAGLEDINGVYYNQVTNLKGLMNKLATGKPVPASNVSLKVLNLVNSKHIPMHLPVGNDAVITNLLKKILPISLFFKMTSFVFARLLQKKVSA